MTSISKPSSFCFSLNIPRVRNLKSNFTYNFYINDEGTNPAGGVPEALKTKSSEQINTETTNLSLRTPRYVTLSWDPPSISPLETNQQISQNLSKIFEESSFLSGKYFAYNFSPKDSIAYAYKDINAGSVDTSQATTIDNYVNDLLKNYSATDDISGLNKLKDQIKTIVESVEKIADNPGETFGVKFYKDDGPEIIGFSGFEKLYSINETLKTQVNALVLPDIFVTSSIKSDVVQKINNSFETSIKNSQDPAFNDDVIVPVKVGDLSPLNPPNVTSTVSFIGYIIDKFEILENGGVKVGTLIIENPGATSAVDVLVKYGSTYRYFIRTVSKIVSPIFDENEVAMRDMTYYVMSSPVSIEQKCEEQVPPPPPVDLNFIWDYRRKKLNIIWGMPPNSQRDIKQFQIFRRKSIYEPFELLKQQCFDFSTVKYQTGEDIDGNKTDMTQEEASFVEQQMLPSMSYIDDEFITKTEDLVSSKFIYAIASIDAHGYISNYSSQFEVSFDFFKNKITKKLISTQGAPRPYPNLLLNSDLFRDVIKTEGADSLKMKVYFMPEYFKIRYGNGSVSKMVATSESNSYYKMQFINTQNQKTESLKITVDDPYGLVNTV